MDKCPLQSCTWTTGFAINKPNPSWIFDRLIPEDHAFKSITQGFSMVDVGTLGSQYSLASSIPKPVLMSCITRTGLKVGGYWFYQHVWRRVVYSHHTVGGLHFSQWCWRPAPVCHNWWERRQVSSDSDWTVTGTCTGSCVALTAQLWDQYPVSGCFGVLAGPTEIQTHMLWLVDDLLSAPLPSAKHLISSILISATLTMQ